MKSITAVKHHREAGNILSNNAERRDRILFSIAVRRRCEAGNILSNNAERRNRILLAADMSLIACWLYVLPRPRLTQNRRNHNGARAGEIGQAQQKMVIWKVWPPKVDNRGRTAAAKARLIVAPHRPMTTARPKLEESQWGKRGGCWMHAARNSRAKSATVRPKEYRHDGARL